MIYLTRIEHFNAAHRLFRSDRSDEENLRVFGKCAYPNWHGHNYELHVTVKGIPSPETGFVCNAKLLSTIIGEVILEKVDHRNLNLDVDFLQGLIPSAENVAQAIWNELQPHITSLGAELHSVRLWETPRICAECSA